MASMSVQPAENFGHSDDEAAGVASQADVDAIELMWMTRDAKPFVPTPWKPFRTMRCTASVRSGPREGMRCGREAAVGTQVCASHGANLPLVKQAAERRKQEAVLRLVGMIDDAIDGLDDLMRNSTSDAVKLKSYTEVLDRAGVRGGTELDVSINDNTDPATLLRERMEQLRRRTIEGEVVRDEAPALEPGDTVHDDTPTAEES